ncbi:MAG TPA: response regulator [Ktedonobacteraceae bacterium]|nr:response regulator [Ktedonobacteraceae bacterium]
MDDFDTLDRQEELSKDDLEVLQTFHNLDFSSSDPSFPSDVTAATNQTYQSESGQSEEMLSEDEMLALFATEADEDISAMQQALQQLELDKRLDSHELTVLKRCAHKLAGTAGAIGCASMSTISRYIETLIKLVEDSHLTFQTTLTALSISIKALETTLFNIVSNGFESKNPLVDLEEEYKRLQIDVHAVHAIQSSLAEAKSDSSLEAGLQQTRELESGGLALRIDPGHFKKMLESAENLIELETPVEHAQKQVEIALNELQFAQSRLRRLEPLLSSLLTFPATSALNSLIQDVGYPPSSLVARILQEASIRSGYIPQTHSVGRPQSLLMQEADLWDEMDIDRLSETNVLVQTFTEALNDVALAMSRLQQALKHLSTMVAQQAAQAHRVRQEAFLLRSFPFSMLASRVQAAIDTVAGEQKGLIRLEVSGHAVDINQDILEKLMDPILEVIQMQIVEVLYFNRRTEQEKDDRLQIVCKAYATNNEISIEIGFSQSISSGLVANLQDAVHHLYGSITLQAKSNGNVTLQLRIPRSRRIIQGLLVRAGNQQVLVSVSQVKRIHFHKSEIHEQSAHIHNFQETLLAEGYQVYQLNTLLGIPVQKQRAENSIQAALLLELDHPGIAIEVDEVVKEVAFILKPLSPYLCRPGITSTASDGNGNRVLVLNLPQIIQQQALYQSIDGAKVEDDTASGFGSSKQTSKPAVCRKILIADDSIFIRQSLHMNLSHEGYEVVEAIDGLETLDQLSKEAPDLLLLDVEMPNLNGYDVLNIIRSHQEYSALKIIMLTSRSSEKHKRRARELGANAYLVKPCSHDDLLETISSLFGDEEESFHEQVE